MLDRDGGQEKRHPTFARLVLAVLAYSGSAGPKNWSGFRAGSKRCRRPLPGDGCSRTGPTKFAIRTSDSGADRSLEGRRHRSEAGRDPGTGRARRGSAAKILPALKTHRKKRHSFGCARCRGPGSQKIGGRKQTLTASPVQPSMIIVDKRPLSVQDLAFSQKLF